ncbi:MAG TPA: sigma-70 family RNA polymerase sigma factor, partial [Anaerolineaceae bacterium]|nr:sigma-70 family RNA polymerase sigma factor [Anaerolineaceae bacterium]
MNPDLSTQFERWYPAVFRYFRLRGADADTANDLASAAFERALRKLSSYDPDRGSFANWIFAIAHNLGADYWKAPATHAPALADELPASDPLPEQYLIQLEDQQALLAALNELDDRQRDLIALKFASRLTNRKIAEITGLSESNVGVILYRALQRLRVSLIRA